MCRYSIDNYSYDSPNTKAFLLLQAHFARLPLPCTDYITDLKSVLDQAIRIIQVHVVKIPLSLIANNLKKKVKHRSMTRFICF